MPLNIEVRMHFGDRDIAAHDVFLALVEVVASWDKADTTWRDLRSGNGWPHDATEIMKGPFSVNDLFGRATTGKDCQQSCFLASTSFNCWRHDSGSTAFSNAILDIHSWSSNSPNVLHGDPEIEGRASLTVFPANPFWAAMGGDGNIEISDYNNRVAENLESLGELFIAIAKNLKPHWIKLFVDAGWNIPFNSHCTYYDGPTAVIDDLIMIKRVWERGLPRYDSAPPLADYDDSKHSYMVSTLRPLEQRLSLHRALSRCIDAATRVKPETVISALDHTSVDVHRVGGGFFLFDCPYYLNSFVSPFFLDTLELASEGRIDTA